MNQPTLKMIESGSEETVSPLMAQYVEEMRFRTQLTEFMQMDEREVLKRFHSLDRDKGINTELYCYIEGTREDKVLLVAHADTVFPSPPSSINWTGNTAVNGAPRITVIEKGVTKYINNPNGIGADDRAGCAMLWNLKHLGHSILITTGEESGCVGAMAAAHDLKDRLGKHQFAVEIDRRGDREYVFYDVSTDEFEDWTRAQTHGFWHEGFGTYTDITFICERVGICGVNFSAGYQFEHTQYESLNLDAWMRTHAMLTEILSKEEIPKFPLTIRASTSGVWHGGWDERWLDWSGDPEEWARTKKSGDHRMRRRSDTYYCDTCGWPEEDCACDENADGEILCLYCGSLINNCLCRMAIESSPDSCPSCGSVTDYDKHDEICLRCDVDRVVDLGSD